MKKVLLFSVVMAFLGFGMALLMPNAADASCACKSVNNDHGTPTTADDTCDTTCCDAPAAPAGPPSNACGEICLTDAITGAATDAVQPVDQLILVAGYGDGSGATPNGCVALLGGAVNSGAAGGNADYTECLADAATACAAHGCATTTSAPGAC